MISLLLVSVALTPATAAMPSPYMDAELIASTMNPRPGSTMVVGFKMTPRPGWHGYWSNPGESGLAPTVMWTAPPGLSFGPLLHPAPTLLQSMGISSFVHSGPHVLVSRVTIGKQIQAGNILPVQASLSWAACSETQCVPQHATLSLQLIAGDGTSSADARVLARSIDNLPRHAPSGRYSVTGGKLVLTPPQGLRLRPTSVRFFPDANGYVDAARVALVDRSHLAIAAPLMGKLPDKVSGVLSDGSTAYQLSFQQSATEQRSDLPSAERPAVEAAPGVVQSKRVVPPDEPEPRREKTLTGLLSMIGLLGFAALIFMLARRRHQ